MAAYIGNAFSFNMIDTNDLLNGGSIHYTPMTTEEVSFMLNSHGDVVSVVGHADTAKLFTKVLGHGIPCNRISLELTKADILIVGQYKGPRLPEGCNELPEGARIDWLMVQTGSFNPFK